MATALGRWTLAIDGSALPDRTLIGGKAWSIAHMRALGLPVPPAFVVTTEACAAFLETGDLPPGLTDELVAGIEWLEKETGRAFGGKPGGLLQKLGARGTGPLLVSVRSGAPISMPGMMDTVLNLGINDETEAQLAKESGDKAFARDTHRRFYELYASIVLKATLEDLDPAAGPTGWRPLIEKAAGSAVPEAPEAQLEAAVRAVFQSWNARRAKRYRAHHNIPDSLGTAVTVQAMIFGNLDDQSGTGVLFTRNPLTGAKEPYGEYLPRAQGEDVVSGKFTPQALSALHASVPKAHDELLAAGRVLEDKNADVQDIEFTVQHGKLYLLQARAAKRAPAAAVRIAVDMVREGAIDEATALSRVTAEQVRVLLSPHLLPGEAEEAELVAQGEGACQGVGIGTVVTDTDEAERRAEAGEMVVLARPTTSPEDVHGMIVAQAIITEKGGSTSHAAVVSRALGRPCIVGCGAGALADLDGETVTVDGDTGRVYRGTLDVTHPDERADPGLADLLRWATARAPLRVVRTGEPEPQGLLDLDETEGGEDPERLPSLLAGVKAAKGGAIASDEGVAAALAAGVETIVADPVLPPLLAALNQSADV